MARPRRTLAQELVLLGLRHPDCARWLGQHPLEPTADETTTHALVRRAWELAVEINDELTRLETDT